MDKMLKPKDIKEILGCSMNRVYDIINCDDFPIYTSLKNNKGKPVIQLQG